MEPWNPHRPHSATSTHKTTYQTKSLKKRDLTGPTVAEVDATAEEEDTVGVEAEAATAVAAAVTDEAVAEDTAADEAADATDTRRN
jgi:hypothetical protein